MFAALTRAALAVAVIMPGLAGAAQQARGAQAVASFRVGLRIVRHPRPLPRRKAMAAARRREPPASAQGARRGASLPAGAAKKQRTAAQ